MADLAKLQSVLNQVGEHGAFVLAALDDPALPRVVRLIQQIKATYPKEPGEKPFFQTAERPDRGVGMRKLEPSLRTFLFLRRNPWIFPVAITTTIAVPILVGYGLGRRGEKRRCLRWAPTPAKP